MGRRIKLTTDGQLAKWKVLLEDARAASASSDRIARLGALVVRSAWADFIAVQAARLLEQIILKGPYETGNSAPFEPHEDAYFFDNRIDTRRILHEVDRVSRTFKEGMGATPGVASRISDLAGDYCESTRAFLNYRNSVFHHLGSPKMDLAKLDQDHKKATAAFDAFQVAHRKFFEAAAPFRFSPVALARLNRPSPKRSGR